MPADRKQVEEAVRSVVARAEPHERGGFTVSLSMMDLAALNIAADGLARAEAAEAALREVEELPRLSASLTDDFDRGAYVARRDAADIAKQHFAAHQQPAPVKAGEERRDG